MYGTTIRWLKFKRAGPSEELTQDEAALAHDCARGAIPRSPTKKITSASFDQATLMGIVG